MKTMTHSVGGRQYTVSGANVDLWEIATHHPRLFAHGDLDTLARAFASSDDNERVAASKILIKKQWLAHPALGPYPFLECLSEFEFERRFHNNYRDHVCHQLKVYLLGLGILACSELLRDAIAMLVGAACLDVAWLVTAVFHDIGYVIENEYSQPGTAPWQRVQEAYRSAMANPLVVLCAHHGLSRATEQLIQKAYAIRTPTLDGMGDLEEDVLFQEFRDEGTKARLAQFMAADPRTPVQRYFSYAQKTASSRPPFKDHGVASALLLTKAWLDLDDYLEKLGRSNTSELAQLHRSSAAAAQALDQIHSHLKDLQAQRQALRPCIMRAAGAMSLHNITPGLWNDADAATQGLTFDTYRIAISKNRPEANNSLAFLLGLVDTLQDWDRPTFSTTPNENALHSQDISIRPSKQAGKVLVHVRRDLEQFVDPPTCKHSAYARVIRILKEFLDDDDVDALVAWSAAHESSSPAAMVRSSQTVTAPDRSWELDFNAIMKMPATDPWRWTVVLSKDEASRHGDLMLSLRRNEDQTHSRYIDSGFAYWGIGPTIQWRRTCQDVFYAVMRTGIETFRRRWNALLMHDPVALPDIYISYGVGTGDKDRAILGTLKKLVPAPVYIPTDMSLDMLVNGAKIASRELLEATRIIPLQIDFSSVSELETIAEVRHSVLMDKPVLYSLLGNTLANFEDDLVLLMLLAERMQDDDLLLLELAATRTASPATARLAATEYRQIPSFDSFVRSALTQHTDLPIDNEVEYIGEICADGETLKIDMNYVSKDRSRGRLIDGSEIVLAPGERIRLYRSRKYTHAAIQTLLARAGLVAISDEFQWNSDSAFGLYLGLCRRLNAAPVRAS